MDVISLAPRPSLSVCIHTRNSAGRIEERITEAFEFADEVVVGVDASSHDQTFERASRLADVTYRFQLPQLGLLAAVRTSVTDYATGDWILVLDDDEGMEPTFDALRDELLGQPGITHHYLARKFLVELSPPAYIRAGPWYPDWQLRLFRNDRSLIWHPPWQPHAGYQVQGAGTFELRTSILHFEPLWCTPAQRALKHAQYREAGSDGQIEKSLEVIPGLPRDHVALRAKPRASRPGRLDRKIHDQVRVLPVVSLPGWKAEFLGVKLAPCVAAGSPTIANVWVRNTGTQAWSVHLSHWPYLNLAFQLLNEKKELIQRDGFRFPMPRHVAPGEKVLFAASFTAPAEPRTYFLEWDLVSELECWFRECGSPTHLTKLEVV